MQPAPRVPILRPMPRPKKRPWNADMKLPGYLGEPPHVVKPAPQTVTVGHSTAQHLPEPARCPTCRSQGKGGPRLCGDRWHEPQRLIETIATQITQLPSEPPEES